jgi:hypothetical protein
MHSINPQLPGDMSYKRNQVEEAIARIFATDSKKARSQLRTRIKRLLELDRSMGRDLRSKDAEAANFGFFSQEAPGTGVDIAFSEYEGFAVLNGLRIMAHGWPQGFAVLIMRRVLISKGSTSGSSCSLRTFCSISKRFAQALGPATLRSTIRIRCFLP